MTAEARALEYTPVSAAALAELRAAQQRGSAITGPGPYADILARSRTGTTTGEVGRFHAVGHDRGAVLFGYLAGNHPKRILRYVRGEQHLWHFHPVAALVLRSLNFLFNPCYPCCLGSLVLPGVSW